VLTIAAIGTPFATQLHDSLALPFSAATGLPVEIQTADGGLEPLKAHAKPDDWDLAELTTADLTAACDAGLLEKIDWGAIGGRDHYAPMGVSDCGVGARVRSDILAWDKDKLPGLPTWGDFFDITKYPGKRGLHRDARGLLEIALMADGVAPGDVYRALGSGDGADRAFRKLDQLRPYIVWWKTGDDALKLLSSGEVLMTEAPYANVMLANRDDFRNFGIQPNFSIVTLDWWAVLKGATGARDAVQFLYFAGTPAIGGKLLDRFAVSVLVRGAYEFARPEAQVAAPLHPANLKNQIQIDEGFWRDNGAKLTARFEQWLEH
jgi:putative spermidine/putrescine transport system substrate-binding protein